MSKHQSVWDIVGQLDPLVSELFKNAPRTPTTFTPAHRLDETPDGVTCTVILPGVGPEDFTLEFKSRTMVLEGSGLPYTHSDAFRACGFSIEVDLPFVPAQDAVEASLAHGVLTVRVASPAPAGGFTVKVS